MRYARRVPREPCPNCEGRGYMLDMNAPGRVRGACVVCNGTRLLPAQTGVRAAAVAARIDAIARAQRRR